MKLTSPDAPAPSPESVRADESDATVRRSTPEDVPPRHASPSALDAGTRLGRYVIWERVGAGGMGVVYAAYDQDLERKVALKLLRSNLAEGMNAEEARTRLLREAQAMARLSHPNVISVFDVGVFGSQVFLAMEFVEGETLSTYLDRRSPDWKEVLKVYLQAGRGLAAAHDAGLIHRDFKPDNVLISHDGRARVTDFGLACAPGQQLAAPPRSPSPPEATQVGSPALGGALRTPLTMRGAIMGTLYYMPLEQLLGEPIDARSDQFSYCVGLYEGLYQQRPFEGEKITELVGNIEAERVGAPPEKSNVPIAVRNILLRGLRARKEDRHRSMADLLDALEAATVESISSKKWLVAVAALLVAGVALAGAHTLWSKPPASGPAVAATAPVPAPPSKPNISHEGPVRLAVLPFKNVGNDPELKSLVEGIPEGIVTDFGTLPAVRLIERGQIKLNLDEIDFEQGTYVDPATRAALGKIAGAEVVLLGGFQRAGNVLRANARFVNVESGEILAASRVEKPGDQLLELQDALALEVKKGIGAVVEKMRP